MGADTIVSAVISPRKVLKKLIPTERRNLPNGVRGLTITRIATPMIGCGIDAGMSDRASPKLFLFLAR